MSELIVPEYKRGINEITEEIREETAQFLRSAIRIGRLLFEAKAQIAQGDWGKYIEEQLPFSHSWANNYMKIYKEYGSEQMSIFGNSQAIMNLRPTQALELLRLPAEEREAFVETHDVENLSTRQLHQQVQEELDKALEKQQELEQQLSDAETRAESAEESSAKAREEVDKWHAEADRHRKERDEECAKVDKLKDQLKKAKDAEKEAKEHLQKALENPEVPEAVMEQMRQQVAADAAKQATEEIQKKLDAALAKADDAAKAAQVAEEKLAAAQKAARLSNPLAVAFRVKFEKVQQEYTAMIDDLKEMRREDPKLAEGMTKAIRALLELWQQSLEG